MKKTKHMTSVARITGFGSIATIVFLLLYSYLNKSGHSGFNPYVALIVFAPSLAFGITNLFTNRNPWKNLWSGIIPTLSGGFGTGLLIFIDKANVLLQYETWIKRGMP
jgi:uncharacterized membrane protein